MSENKSKSKNTKKEEFSILGVKRPNGVIVVETEIDQLRLNSLATGTALKIIPIKNSRNYQHHKKFFKLLSEAYLYWEPEFKVLTKAEEWLANDIKKSINQYLGEMIKNNHAKETFIETIETLVAQSKKRLEDNRKDKLDYEGMKTLESFLDYVMKKAGCFNIVPLPDGGTLMQRWSIAFDKMPQNIFNDVYKRCFGVIWNEMMSDVFATEEELEERVNFLLNFD